MNHLTPDVDAPASGHPGILGCIAALKKANEPSRELDLAIRVAIFPKGDIARVIKNPRGLGREGYSWDIGSGSFGGSVLYEMRTSDGRVPVNGGYSLPLYTSSVDAARELLRPHYLWQLKQGIACHAIVWWIEHDWDNDVPEAFSSTFPALALTHAALIARAIEDRVTA